MPPSYKIQQAPFDLLTSYRLAIYHYIYHYQISRQVGGVRIVNTRIASVILVAILTLIPLLPASAQDSSTGTISITMTTEAIIEIELSPINWDIGPVEPDKVYKTNPEKTWCTMTNLGNCIVDTYIKGEDAEGVSPSTQKWTLSADGNNGEDEYALWYWIGYVSDNYVPITKYTTGRGAEFYSGLEIGEEKQKQFGLKLLTPTSFQGDMEMKSTITISAVAA